MRRRSIVATVALLMSISAFAAHDACTASMHQCPDNLVGPASAVGAAAAVSTDLESSPPHDAATSRASGEVAATPQRVRPRWQSLLPGMMR